MKQTRCNMLISDLHRGAGFDTFGQIEASCYLLCFQSLS